MNDTPNVATTAAAPVLHESAAAPPEESFYEANESFILGAGFIVAVLAVWELYPLIFGLSKAMKLFFTAPSDVAVALYELLFEQREVSVLGSVWAHFYASATAFGIGLGLSIVVALPLGVILGRSQTMDAMVDPFITALNATPRLVFLPLVLIWFGIGLWSVVVIVFIGAVFPLLINTYAGVKNADRLLINVVRSFGANEWHINRLVVLPNSLPFIVAGLRLAIGRAILGVVVAEFFGGAEAGLGKMMVIAAQSYAVDVLFAGLIIFMAISLVMTGAVKQIETRLNRWRPEKVKTF
jgi:NitT/TauT family transport system permease protein